jgi:hypothetical protein
MIGGKKAECPVPFFTLSCPRERKKFRRVASLCDDGAMRALQEQEQEAKILIEQADRLIGLFAIDVSGVPPYDPAQKPWNASPLFSRAAHAYDQLAAAEKKTDRVKWERTKETHGRTAGDVMQRLWDLLEEIRRCR